MKITMDQKSIILEKLTAPANDQSALELVRWLDITCCDKEDYTSVYYQLFARSVIALGYYLINENGRIPAVIETIRKGEDYALKPEEASWDAFCESASNSYPFGPGNGCLSIKALETGTACAVGTGCTSGSGTLLSLGIPAETVMTVLSEELIPWISGTGDPVISRPDPV